MPDDLRADGGRAIPSEPAPGTWYRRRFTLRYLRELADAGPLVGSLIRREFQARYHQTRLGLLWAVITPVLLLVVFVFVFNRVTDLGGDSNADYAVSTYLGLLPWTFFASSISRGGQSLVFEAGSVNKVRAPREVFPLTYIAIAMVDFAIAVALLPVLFVLSGNAPAPETVWVPLALAVQVVFTVGATLVVAAIVVFIRDLGQALPLIIQMGLFATPVAYPIGLSAGWEKLYAALNPLVAVIDTYRSTILGGETPDWGLLGIAAASSLLIFLGGYVLFKHLEPEMADVA